jgi:hypothetical protein
MELDYPAAHSMDSEWYAVDKNGNVALFITGAGGAMPLTAYNPDACFEDFSPEELEEMGLTDEMKDRIDPEQLPDRTRLFIYQAQSECLADRYERKKRPRKPLHVDDLEAEVRDTLGRVQFDRLEFGQTQYLQPIEWTECGAWDPAYLTSDGKTVKPVPGQEKEYKKFARQLRTDFGDEGPVVEGLD